MISNFVEILESVLTVAGERHVESFKVGDIEIKFRPPTDVEIQREIAETIEEATRNEFRASGFDEFDQGLEEAKARKAMKEAQDEALAEAKAELGVP